MTATLLSAADGSRHGIDAGRAELGEVRLQASLNPAAARLDPAAHRGDIGAAFVGKRCHPEQGDLAWPRQIRQV